MSAPEVVTVVEEYVYATLAADSAVQAALGNPPRIYPAYGPEGALAPFLTHDLIGSDVDVAFDDGPPLAYRIHWNLTLWGEGPSRQQLRAPMQAALAALVGPNLAGFPAAPFGSAVDGSLWTVATSYAMPMPEPALAGQIAGEGAWARLAHAITLFLIPG